MTRVGTIGRVGGLAAALGAGVLIGLAAAAPASADSTDAPDTAAQSAGRDAAPTPRRAAPSVRADRGSAARVVRPARVARPSAADDQASKTALTAVRREARSNAPAPAATAGPVTAGPVTAQTPAVAPAPTALKSPRSLFGWGDPRGRLITIYKGTHFAIPNSFGFFVKQVSGTGTFTPNTVYDLKDVDQYDWNKFTGIAFTPLEPDRNSVMVGWRYNLTSQEFEIAPFYNVDKKRILPNEVTEVISVPADQTFNYLVDYTGVTISYGDKTVFKPFPPGLTPSVWTAARVSGWFGGNEVAPRTVSYYLKINR